MTQHRTAAWNVIVSLFWLRIVKTNATSSSNIEGFGGIPGPEAYQIKNEYAQRRRLRRINSLLKRRNFHDLSASTKPKNEKASLSKVQALKFIPQIAASKLENCVFPNSNLQILSSKSKSTLFFCQLVQLQVFKNLLKKSKIIYRNFGSFWKNEFGALILSVFLFFKKQGKKEVFCLVKWAKTNAFVFPIGKMKLIKMLNPFQPIELWTFFY